MLCYVVLHIHSVHLNMSKKVGQRCSYKLVSHFQQNSELTSENVNSIDVGKFFCTRDVPIAQDRSYPWQKNHKISKYEYINISCVYNHFVGTQLFRGGILKHDYNEG